MIIAHLSDLHISVRHRPANLQIACHLIKTALARGADHFILSGDLVNNPHPENYLVLRDLLERYGLLDGRKLTIAIGNHEIYGGVHLAEDIIYFPQRSNRVKLKERERLLKSFFPEAFENTITYANDDIFPYLKIIDSVAFIVANSIASYSYIRNLFGSRGRLSKSTYNRLRYLLQKATTSRFRIFVMHHHLNGQRKDISAQTPFLWKKLEWYTLKFKGKNRLIALLRKYGVDALLHGHIHETFSYQTKGITCYNAAGCVQPLRDMVHRFFLLHLKRELKCELVQIADLLPEKGGHLPLTLEPAFNG